MADIRNVHGAGGDFSNVHGGGGSFDNRNVHGSGNSFGTTASTKRRGEGLGINGVNGNRFKPAQTQNTRLTKAADLVSIPTLVESPFIYVTIGSYTFGLPQKKRNAGGGVTVDFPNFMQSLTVTKVNGEINTYQLKMVYQIKQGDDPNLIDNILSSISDTRTMTISYGDWCHPSQIFKEEEVLVTNVKSNIEFASSRISYDIAAVSKAMNLMSQCFNFPAYNNVKPSKVLLSMISNPAYGIQKNFTGMANKQKVLAKQLIATDDKAVRLEAKINSSVYDYANYLVSSMIPNSSDSTVSNAYYALSVIDDNKNDLGGSYFKVTKIGDSDSAYDGRDSYELDVGYPGNNFITNFTINDNEAWSILFDSSNTSRKNDFSYTYDSNGYLTVSDSPSVTRSRDLLQTTSADKAWWTKMTEFPISATLDFKGLVRPTLLVSYVKINVVYYGRRHITSGTYIITKQVDTISASGYKTQLSLQRVKGEGALGSLYTPIPPVLPARTLSGELGDNVHGGGGSFSRYPSQNQGDNVHGGGNSF